MKYIGIQVALAKNNMTQTELAERLKMPRSSLSQKLNGIVKLGVDDSIRICTILNSTFEELFLPNKLPIGNISEEKVI